MKAKAQTFNCRFVGLMFVHNYMMVLRDKSNGVIKDATQLKFLDIRKRDDFMKSSVFRSEMFNIAEFNQLAKEKEEGAKQLEAYKFQLKTQISMKYLFIIGDHSDFDNEVFRTFLETIISMEGSKPFKMFLYKFNHDILKVEYPYLFVENQVEKRLALYPYVILNSKNITDMPADKVNF
jgi:hypothetical protein